MGGRVAGFLFRDWDIGRGGAVARLSRFALVVPVVY